MKAIEAQELLKRFDAPQKRRFDAYTRNLSIDRDKRHRDKPVREVLDVVAYNPEHVADVFDYLETIGFSQSKYSYEQIDEQIVKFEKPNHKWFGWNKNYKAAKQRMIDEFHEFGLKSRNFRSDEEIIDSIPKKDTHAGWAWINSGMKSKREYLDGVHLAWLEEVELAKTHGSFSKPILIGTRTQASGQFSPEGDKTGKFKSKSRLVSMIDIYQIVSEMVFARPLQGRLNTVEWYAGGYDDLQLGSLISKARHGSRYSFTIDYSSFDQSISSWLIHDAFDIVKAAFDMDPFFDERLFNVIVNDFVHKAFIDGRGEVRESHKGVPSGSMFTQIIDSLVNRLVILTYALAKKVDVRDMFIMGDDNLILSNDEIDEDDLSKYVLVNFGLVINSNKCSKGTTADAPEFLSRFWDFRGVWREPNVLISKLIYPEKFRDYRAKHGPNPVLILYSYILSYPLGMSELLDISKFKRDNMRELATFSMSDYLPWMPGSAQVRSSTKV